MNTFKDYIRYKLKSSLLRTVAFSVIAFIMTYYSVYPSLIIYNRIDDVNANYYYEIEGGIYAGYLDLSAVSTILVIAALIIAVLETSGFKNKRNLDTLYSLSLSRFQLALAHYLSGALQVLAVYTSSALCALVTALPYAGHLKLWLLPAYYVLALLFGLGFYSFVLFFFGEANTVADGFIFVCAGLYAGNIIIHLVDIAITPFTPYMSQIVWRNFIFLERYWGTALEPISNISKLFTDMIGCTKFFEYTVIEIRATFAMFFVWGTVFAACAYGYFHAFIRKGAEKAGEISESPFGYRFLIPFYGFCLILSGISYLYTVFIFALMFIGYVIYRRTAKIKKCDIAILIVAVALSLCTMYQPLEHILPFAASAVLTVVSLVLFIAALIKKAGAKEVLKRAILLALSICLLVLLIPGAYEILCYYGRMHLYPGMFY
jgi:hypothetical protein